MGTGVSYSAKEDNISTQMEAEQMQDHAKEHVEKYRGTVKAKGRNMWTMNPAAKANAAATMKQLQNGGLKPLEDEDDEDDKPKRREKKALTATANLVKQRQAQPQT